MNSESSETKSTKRSLVPIIAVVAGIFIFAFAMSQLPVKDWITEFKAFQQGLSGGEFLLFFFAFVAAYIFAVVFFIPGSIVTLGAGAIYGVFFGTLAVSIGSVTGATLAFLISRYVANDYMKTRFGNDPKFKALNGAIGENDGKLVALIRLSPVFPFNVINYIFGLTRVKLSHYVLASWLGMLPGTILYVYIGQVSWEAIVSVTTDREKSPWEWVLLVIGLIVTAIVTVMITKRAKSVLDSETQLTESASTSNNTNPQAS